MATTERDASAFLERTSMYRPVFSSCLLFALLVLFGSLQILPLTGTGIMNAPGSALLGGPNGPVDDHTIASPDGNIELDIRVGDLGTQRDCLLYNLTIQDVMVITNSRLGLVFGNGVTTLGRSLSITNTAKANNNSSYKMTFGDRDLYPDRYNSMTIEVKETADPYRTFFIEARVYDEGAAMRYISGSQGWPATVSITGELTGFNFKDDHYCYTEYGTEGSYTRESVRQVSSKCESPLTVEMNGGDYLSLTEANTTDYSRMYLNRDTSTTNGLKVQLDSSVGRKVPFTTPWRVIVYGESPGDLVANGHILNSLCPPSIFTNTSWITPGKAFRDCSLTTKGSKEVIDFCAGNGLQYVHLDAGWYGSEWSSTDATKVAVQNLNLTEVIRYGNQKGIGVILYVNERALKGKIGTLFPLYEKWGVKGVKFGFVDGRTQDGINFLHKAVEKAGEHHLVIDIHDNYRPTGLSRTYPNLLTVEGVRGNEHFPYPKHNTIIPFTRSLAGPMDYTPRYHPKEGVTTYSHQLALPVMYFSPLTYLYWYHKPSGVEGKNGTGFWATMPTVWNETRYLDGDPGSYSSVARRTGDDWYWCWVNGPSANSISVDLDFLEDDITYNATFYQDEMDGSIGISSYLVDSSVTLEDDVDEKSGISIRFKPASAIEKATLKRYRPYFTNISELISLEDQLVEIEFIHLNGHSPPKMELVTNASFLTLDKQKGRILGIPGNEEVGTYSVIVRIKEEFFDLKEFSMNLTVKNVNDDPRITSVPGGWVKNGTIYIEVFKAVDVDPTNDTLSWSCVTNCEFLTFHPSNRTLLGRAVDPKNRSYWINISVSDGKGGYDHINYTLVIKERFDTVLKFLHEEYPMGSKDLRRCSSPPRKEARDAIPLEIQGSNGKYDVLIGVGSIYYP